MVTMQQIHVAWSNAHCAERKAPDQCNKWRGDAPYVDAVSAVEPHTVLRSTRQLAQSDEIDPELEVAYSVAFRVWIAPPVEKQFELRGRAAAAWREARPDISSREHSQTWRDKFIRLAFDVLHSLLVADPGRVPTGHLVDDDAKLLQQMLVWAGEATQSAPERLSTTNPLRQERVLIASKWRSQLIARARKLGLTAHDAEDVASEAILHYLRSSPSDDVPLLWVQLDYAIRRHSRNQARQRRLAERIKRAYSPETTADVRESARKVTGFSQDAEVIITAILSERRAAYTKAFFLAALERGDQQFAGLPHSEKLARLEAALNELRSRMGGGSDA